jgi:hypothetical protein
MSLSEHLDRAAAIRRGAVPTRRSPAVGGDFVVLDLTTTQRDDEEPVVDLTDGPAPQRRSTRPNPDEVSPVSALAREQRYEHLSLFGADNQIRAVARTLHRMSVQAPAELPAASSTPAPVVPQPTSRTTVPPTTTAASSDAAQARQAAAPLAATAATLARLRARAEEQAQEQAHALALAPVARSAPSTAHVPAAPVAPSLGVVRVPELPDAFVPRWSTAPVVAPSATPKRRLGALRRKSEGPVRVPTCPGCGHTARIDIADRTTGRLHMSCPYCFRMWQTLTTPTAEPHESVRLQG